MERLVDSGMTVSYHVRPPGERDAIWRAYEALVAYAAGFLRLMISEDIVWLVHHEKAGWVKRRDRPVSPAGQLSILPRFHVGPLGRS